MSSITKTIGTESSYTDTPGTKEWQRLNDPSYPYSNTQDSATIDSIVKLLKGGVISGSNLAKELTLANKTNTYGGETELWGLSFTKSDIESADFGFAFMATGTGLSYTSDFLFVKDLGFSFPEGTTINGIKLITETSTNSTNVFMLSYELTVYYSVPTPIVGNKYPLPPFRSN